VFRQHDGHIPYEGHVPDDAPVPMLASGMVLLGLDVDAYPIMSFLFR
jgi:hypothetical protein